KCRLRGVLALLPRTRISHQFPLRKHVPNSTRSVASPIRRQTRTAIGAGKSRSLAEPSRGLVGLITRPPAHLHAEIFHKRQGVIGGHFLALTRYYHSEPLSIPRERKIPQRTASRNLLLRPHSRLRGHQFAPRQLIINHRHPVVVISIKTIHGRSAPI